MVVEIQEGRGWGGSVVLVWGRMEGVLGRQDCGGWEICWLEFWGVVFWLCWFCSCSGDVCGQVWGVGHEGCCSCGC